jgi:hypothetical protein
MLTDAEIRALKPQRHARKVSDGGGLYLLVMPKGGRCWRYAYRFARTYKTLSLGMYPDVPLERARSRHEFARNLFAHGLDPAAMKAALGKHAFTITMRTWEIARTVEALSRIPKFTLRLEAALGKHTFIAMMREWKKAPDQMSNLCP